MGAETFFTKSEGQTADHAFWSAVEQASYDHGHGGYTGTIAEKYEFVMVECPVGIAVMDHVHSLEEQNAFPFEDKWGPAGCVALTAGRWLFFGSASS